MWQCSWSSHLRERDGYVNVIGAGGSCLEWERAASVRTRPADRSSPERFHGAESLLGTVKLPNIVFLIVVLLRCYRLVSRYEEGLPLDSLFDC